MARKLQSEKTSKTIMWSVGKDLQAEPQRPSRFEIIPKLPQDQHQQQPYSPYHHRKPQQSPEELKSRGRSFIQPHHPQALVQRQQSVSRTRTFTRSNTPECDHCGRLNHNISECWRASRSCLICGKDHHMEQCSQFDPNHRSRSQVRSPRSQLN